mgnify:FL=1
MAKRYILANGFHRRVTWVRVDPVEGATVPGATMRAAWRRLCPGRDCRCWGSPASNPHVQEGIPGIDLTLVRSDNLREDRDEHILVPDPEIV